MNEDERIRARVAESYAKAIAAAPGSCCSGASPSGDFAKLAGYDHDALPDLVSNASATSFGCGNPLAFSGVKPGDVVLDLGSGAGLDLMIAAERVGPGGQVIGIDMTDEMIAKARENITASGLGNVEVRKGIIEDLPVKSSSVDWVISNCVINLSPDKPSVFAEIARVLKHGGQMLVSDVVAEELPDWVRQNEVLYSSCVAGAISEDDYLRGLRDAGLDDCEVRGRIIYDSSQLSSFLSCELPHADPAVVEWIESHGQAAVRQMIESMTGKIWSANFYARRP